MFKVSAITLAHNGFSESFHTLRSDELSSLLDLRRTLEHRNR